MEREGVNVDGERLEQKLQDYFRIEVQNIEPRREWWDNAIARLGEQEHRSHRSGLIPKIRLAWVLLPLILLLIGGTVYGANSLIKELFQRFATHIEQAGLAQELDLSQTVDGITVKLERAYADANVVLVGFTVSGPKTRYYSAFGELSTSDGQDIAGMIGMGIVPGSDAILGSWLESERLATIAVFDASSIGGRPSELDLTLETSVADSPMFGEQASVGPFTFDFRVPFHAGKVIEIGQTVEAAGVPIKLEQVVVSPWATRAVFGFAPPYDGSKDRPSLITSLQPAGDDFKNCSLGRVLAASSAEFFVGDFTTQPGEWTITVKELVFPPEPSGQKAGTHPASDTKRLAGPWVFRFQVP